jgi:thioredoxin-like negative regulator of GroEL
VTGPSGTERVIEELGTSGELPDVVAALEQKDYERALELLLDEIAGADADRRKRLAPLAVELFRDLGDEDPLTMRYRRRLASLLF